MPSKKSCYTDGISNFHDPHHHMRLSVLNKFLLILVVCVASSVQNLQAQEPTPDELEQIKHDSINKRRLLDNIGNGYFPTKFLNLDLRYLIKFNQYEGFRTGLGGVTNDAFSERYRINSYVVYGFKDHRWKFRIGGGFRIAPKTSTWLHLSYTDDLIETGSSTFLTDKRFFSFFEPRLINIDLFHKHITKALNLEHSLHPKLLTETELSISKIDPTYDYSFNINGQSFENFDVSLAKVAFQWSPFDEFENEDGALNQTKNGYPKMTLQLTQGFDGVLKGDFNFFKADFRTIHKLIFNKDVFTEATLTSGWATGDTPLTHLYHAYPNNVNKPTILERFSVAGINSFETMYFNEFFSDRYATLQLKHYVKPFKITEKYRPQLVLISRMAIGDMSNIERHQGIEFGTFDQGFSEAGIELNKLLFGFGLSFAYRYGAYHLPKLEDNMALKFTFNITL